MSGGEGEPAEGEGDGDGEDVSSDCASDYTPGPAPKRHPTGVVGSSSGGTGDGATGGIGLHLSGGSNKGLGSLGHQVEKSQKLEDLREVVGEAPGTGGTDGPEEPALPSLEGVSEKQYTIYIAPGGGDFTTWNGSLTLELVNEKFWKVSRPLELCYAHTKDPK